MFAQIFIILSILFCEQKEDQFYLDLNKIRVQNNLSPLTSSFILEHQALHWLREMHKNGPELKHDKIKGGGEVMCRNCDDLLAEWMNSPPHKAILLSDEYSQIGLAIVNRDACARLIK
jgi:uncharacterized protein YkwD